MNYLDGLNEQQKLAAGHLYGPMLVVAGAGTGKTKVITHRIAHLISTGEAKPSEILALTYTDKAAREMTERLDDLIGWDSAGVQVMTYNAFGGRLLSRYSHHIGRGIRGGLLSEEQKTMLLQQRMLSLSLEYYTPQTLNYGFAEKISQYISSLQNAGVTLISYQDYIEKISVENILHPAEIAEQRDLAAMYKIYESLKIETETYDYADQINIAVQILEQRPNVIERLRNENKFVLVDEYQDTSPVQDALLRLMVPPGGNIFAVGDDDQAIYGFRGSDIKNIMQFTSHFGVRDPIVLTENYRSGQSILDAAYRLIQFNNPDRLEEKLKIVKRLTSQAAPADIQFVPYDTTAQEQSEIVTKIQKRLDEGELPSSIAVLARGKSTLRNLAKGLRSHSIPFAMSAELSIFEQRELLGLWYLLEWVGGRASDEAIAHVVIGPFVGWTVSKWQQIVRRAKTDVVSVEEALGTVADEGDQDAAVLLKTLRTWQAISQEKTVADLAVSMVVENNALMPNSLVDRLKEEANDDKSTARVVRVINDFWKLFDHMTDFATASALGMADTGLTAYLKNFPMPPVVTVNEAIGQADGVQLLTVHASKGLEFDTVYVINVTNRTWTEQPDRGLVVPPELDTRQEVDPIAEQRRLMYVAVTRAKRELILSSGMQTSGGQKQPVSGFIAELLETYSLEPINKVTDDNLEKTLDKLQQFYPLEQEIPELLPFEQADGWIQISVSDIDRFDKVPHDFLMERVLGLSQPTGPHLAFGTAVHGVIQFYYESKLAGLAVKKSDLLARLDELWSDRGYPDRQSADNALQRAQRTVVEFIVREETTSNQIVATELPIRFELPEYKLRLIGRIDATFETPNGFEVRDFKTGVRRDAEKLSDEAKKSLQLRTYALALMEKTGRTPDYVTLDFVVSGITGTAELTTRILSNHRIKLGQLAEKLRAHDFNPGPPSDHNRSTVFKYFGMGDAE